MANTLRVLSPIIFLLLLAFPAAAQQECIFDTQNQEEVLIELQKKYRGAKYNLKEKTLETPWDKGVIRYQRGGCSHFGENVKYWTSVKSDFSNKSLLFAQVVKMTKEFFRDLISGSEIEALLQKGKYSFLKSKHGDVYSIPHERVIDLFILYSYKDQNHMIEIGYYIN